MFSLFFLFSAQSAHWHWTQLMAIHRPAARFPSLLALRLRVLVLGAPAGPSVPLPGSSVVSLGLSLGGPVALSSCLCECSLQVVLVTSRLCLHPSLSASRLLSVHLSICPPAAVYTIESSVL